MKSADLLERRAYGTSMTPILWFSNHIPKSFNSCQHPLSLKSIVWPSWILALYLLSLIWVTRKSEKTQHRNLHLAPVGCHLASCFCSPVSKVACVAFASAGVVSSLSVWRTRRWRKMQHGNLHLAPVGSHLAHCFCSPVSKVACVAFASTGVVSSLINSKDERVKEDAAREPPHGTRGVPLGPLFL